MAPLPSAGRVAAATALAAVLFLGSAAAFSTLPNHLHQTPHAKSLTHQNTPRIGPACGAAWALRAVENEEDPEDAEGGSGGERRRKRDILKRTFGLGSYSPPTSGDGSDNTGSGAEPVKLNTDSLFRGVPGVDSMLGGSSVLPGIMASAASSASGSDNRESGGESDGFQKQGQQKEPDLLSPEDLSSLESKYDSLRAASEDLVENELSKGASGELSDDGKGLNITQTEAKKIVDYAVEEERLAEQREWNQRKKEDLIAGWEAEGRKSEQAVEQDLENSGDGGEGMLREDGVAREIIQNAEERETNENEQKEKRRELDFYQRQQWQRREVEGAAEKAARENQGADLDDVYAKSLEQIQSSRRDKLGPRTLGVLSNSIPLEEGREYVRKQKEQKEFLKEVEAAAGLVGRDDAEVAAFFRAPGDFAEERMYRSIVRRIVDGRPDDPLLSAPSASVGEDEDEEPIPMQEDVREKYQLSAQETVEAYKLLNLWREMRAQQDAMEEALGMRDASESSGAAARPTNKLEPFFLYEEDSEEKRAKERENLIKVLKKGLESDDAVEGASNELLMKELLEGGVTKERAARLLDKLLAKATSDTIRASLEELKGTILSEDDGGEVDDEQAEGSGSPWLFRKRTKKTGAPVDLSGVFGTAEEEPASPSLPSKSTESTGRSMPSWVDSEKAEQPPPPPSTPFFSPSPEEEGSLTEAAAAKASPPPNTPFFQSSDEDTEAKDGPAGGMFGTYEEQRIQKLASKVGAQTEEEVEELRRNVEALKEVEEMANAQLSDEDFDIEAASAKLGINMDALNLDSGDDDQIMSIVGKRPVASSSTGQPGAATSTETDDIIVDAEGNLVKMETEKGRADIADDIFRAKTAGKYHDKETRDSDEAAYRAFVQMEEEAEKRFDSIDGDEAALPEEAVDDIDAYADDIMSEMKPRPQVKGRREDFMSQEELQRERKMESMFGDDDPFPVQDESRPTSSSGGGDMPEWFRKEQEAMGIRVEDLDEDDLEEARREWEREERQRMADEYLEKRGEGISISDVLGREYFGPMDEPIDDYKTQSPFDSFEARRELLLGYTELTVEDINNVVDYRVDPLATGYNQYLSKVQKPFSEYGAIFRLEGVLVDMVGLHAKAWKKVSETTGYQIQSGDEVRQASLYKPEVAVREVFMWTDDIFELKEIAETHRTAFGEAFDDWLATGMVSSGDDYEPISRGTSESNAPQATPSDEEMNSMYYLAWSKLATSMDKPAPTNDDVYRGVMGGDWEVAVRDIFGWSDDPSEVYDTVVAYDEILQQDYKILLEKYGIDLDQENAEQEESQFGLHFPDVSLKEGVVEWLDTLREVDMPHALVTHLDSSQVDAVLNATGLAEYFPHDTRVSADSGYGSERSEMLGAALRVAIRPDQCVVFDNTPHSANEAHEVCMKSVSLVDHYARYELLTADWSVGYARDLDLMSFVKLFDERTDLDLEPILELDTASGMQKQQRKAKTAFWDD
ncbi:hypothetical protein ACHAXT_007989 [Thalassiosira profunda]